jgi:hypothetical protein
MFYFTKFYKDIGKIAIVNRLEKSHYVSLNGNLYGIIYKLFKSNNENGGTK